VAADYVPISHKCWPAPPACLSTSLARVTHAENGAGAAFQQAKADHDFTEQELELKTNTQLTREIHTLTTELHNRLLDGRAG
jgi:hypothetical protein